MYEIILYDTEDGRCPVQELLDSLEPKLLAKTLRTIDLLEINGPLLREPYSKPLENGIFELRNKQVGRTEADPINGKISDESPVGHALLGKAVGEKAEVLLPSGQTVEYEVLAITHAAN